MESAAYQGTGQHGDPHYAAADYIDDLGGQERDTDFIAAVGKACHKCIHGEGRRQNGRLQQGKKKIHWPALALVKFVFSVSYEKEGVGVTRILWSGAGGEK